MANIRRTDSSDFQRPADNQPPIVLARLPHVGAEQPTATTTMRTQVVPEPEHLPQLDLQADIARQTRLHIADTANDDTIPNTRHFADHRHAADTQPPASATRTRQQPTPQQQSFADASTAVRSNKQSTLSARLFQLHAQVAPHAGLIVALALIASAGVVYWMIVGPAQPPLPQYEYGTEFPDEALGSISGYTPEFVAEAPQPVAASAPVASSPADDQWEKVELSNPSPDEPTRGEVDPAGPQPVVEPTKLQELPTADDSPFPQTDTPNALDFSKVQPIQTSPTSSNSPQPQAEVAGRESSTTTR